MSGLQACPSKQNQASCLCTKPKRLLMKSWCAQEKRKQIHVAWSIGASGSCKKPSERSIQHRLENEEQDTPSPSRALVLVAPYCAIPRDYLSDTPLLRAMGFLVSQHGQLGAIPPPPFLRVSPLESMRSGGAIPPPPPQKGYLSDTGAIPYENKANGCDTPLCDTISKGYCAIGGGGVSRTGPLRH